MDEAIKEMIALGASYAVNCHPCMEYHKQKAIEAGVTEEQMRAALEVGAEVKNGAANITRKKAKALFGDLDDQKSCSA
jgi:AhpD family alkylhydroperoxidase